ncbi:MAG: UDP-N-acetylmuramoyl-tripeptide--D-alanyl-D-alanine ligase [Bacteroidia bacterium]|nr:UDP-N-acetylmuramoyl-tripeptide--D-alanyl-D-alanine ligase [Bacteroidia bacterium]
MSIEELYKAFSKNNRVCTDSRKLQAGDIFFALKGPNFDGNKFAIKAIEQGAILSVADDQSLKGENDIIIVEDALRTLQTLALFHRKKLGTKIIAITGSNGKTTTKELLAGVLSKKFNTYATKGNLNNHIGVPLSLLELNSDNELAVIEMGANHAGEIASYCEFTDPDLGLITNIAAAHLEGFGDINGVLKAKSELFEYLNKRERTFFLNSDDERLKDKWATNKNICSFGTSNTNDSTATLVVDGVFVGIEWTFDKKNYKAISNLTGMYNFSNLLASLCVAKYFEIDDEAIADAFEEYKPSNMRSQVTMTKHNTVVMDAYNANPSSMKVALENMQRSFAQNIVLILGDMNELGILSDKFHNEILEAALAIDPQKIFLVGKRFKTAQNEKVLTMDNVDQLIEHIKQNKISGSNILVKGSRTVGLEGVMEVL